MADDVPQPQSWRPISKSRLRVVSTDQWLIALGATSIILCCIGFGTIAAFPFALSVIYSFAVLSLGLGGIERKIAQVQESTHGHSCNPMIAVTDKGKLVYHIEGQGTYGVIAQRIVKPVAKQSIEFQWHFVPADRDSPPVLIQNLSAPGKAIAIALVLKNQPDIEINSPTRRERVAQIFLASLHSDNNRLSAMILLLWVPQLIMVFLAFSWWCHGDMNSARGSLLGAPLISLYFVPFILTHVWSLPHKTVILLINVLLMPVGASLAGLLKIDSALFHAPFLIMWSALVAGLYLAHKMPLKARSFQESTFNENLFLKWNPVRQNWGYPLIEESKPSEQSGLLRAGDVLDERYRIIECVGVGGMGAVYKANDEELNRMVAIKVLKVDHLAKLEDRKRFKLEAKLLSELLHANVVKLYRFGVAPNHLPFLIMEYFPGNGLNRLILSENCLLPPRAINLLLQLCDGLQAAHDKGIVHRDLKPSNILVGASSDQEEQLKIIDFGLASGPENFQSQRLTASGLLIGTAAYMSPEQCMGKRADSRSDIYAFGCVAYEMLVGEPPFTCENPIGLLAKQISQTPPSIDTFRRDVPPSLNKIIAKAMSKSPEDRYQTVREIRDDLQEILDTEDSPIQYTTHNTHSERAAIIGAPFSSKALPDLLARTLFVIGTLGQFLPLLKLGPVNDTTFVLFSLSAIYIAGVIHFRASSSPTLVFGIPFITLCLFEIALMNIFRYLSGA